MQCDPRLAQAKARRCTAWMQTETRPGHVDTDDVTDVASVHLVMCLRQTTGQMQETRNCMSQKHACVWG